MSDDEPLGEGPAEPPGGEEPSTDTRVLVVCRTAGAMVQLLAALTAAGHLTTGRYTDDEALAALVERPFDVLILDASVEPEGQARLRQEIDTRGLRAVRVLVRGEGQAIDDLLAAI